MALGSITLTPDPQHFPPATECEIYEAAAFRDGAAPAGATVAANATVASDGTLPITGAPLNTPLIAYNAGAGDVHRCVRFMVKAADPLEDAPVSGEVVGVEGAWAMPTGGTCSHLANFMRGIRIMVPRSGILCDLHELVASIGSGLNVRGAVYDTGEALAGSYSRLWLGEAVAGATGWLKLGDPDLEVAAGQELVLAAAFSATQGSAFGQAVPAGHHTLPTGFDRRGLAFRRVLLGAASSATPPAAITNANFTADTSCPRLIARVR